LTRRSTQCRRRHIELLIFQFTTSRGGRLFPSRKCRFADTFQFTTSRGGRLIRYACLRFCLVLSIHDLTRRSTLFKSRETPEQELSIHDLTRRSTQTASSPSPKVSFQFTT